jgi:hypothetical protein
MLRLKINKVDKKTIIIGSVMLGVIILLVAAYFFYNWYLANYGVVTDANNDTMNTDTSLAPDYRSAGIQDLGLANNNPGNLRPDGENWHGMTGVNGGFMSFVNLWYGIRAAALNITTLIKTFGSVQAYVSAYAPPSENNTAAYIQAICSATGLKPTDKPPLNNAMLSTIVRAHFNQENGSGLSQQYISDNDIRQGIALITDPLGASLYPA